jgi:NTE family protein
VHADDAEQFPREAVEPVRRIPGDEEEPEDKVALCLSGGGYRAMLFHTGAIWRLVETGYIAELDRVSSVSGGSITAARLALRWDDVARGGGDLEAYVRDVVEPLRELARHTIDADAVVRGALTPDRISERVAKAYRKHLLDDATLQDLPEEPRFVINATNVGSGALWRFSREYMADYRVGRIPDPELDLAVAVACSSAFPPFLSPYVLELEDADWTSDRGNDLGSPEHRDCAVLTDGGVYDNLGLETAWKRCRTVLVSDAGGELAPDVDPAGDWGRHMYRVGQVVDNQVRALRKRQLQFSYRSRLREGAYFSIRSDIDHFGLPDALPCPKELTLALANVPTRLAPIEPLVQERLINWGYAACDVGLRAHVPRAGFPAPAAFPYPDAGVG